jgi:hypothetical protein
LFLYVGVRVGSRVQDFLNAHHSAYVVIGVVIALAVGYVLFRVARVVWFHSPPPDGGRGEPSSPPAPDR